jgi:negative regulator of flagellin synthesis FlgM
MAALDGIGTLGPALGSLSGNVSGVSQAAQSAATNGTGPAVSSSAASLGTDQASVSSTGGLVAQALSTPDVRTDKVAELQSAIASGSYQVPASEVAGKIVDSLLK